MDFDPAELDSLPREDLILRARARGVERPEQMTRVELRDEIVRRSEPDLERQRRSRGWLGVARDLLASVVESGLNLPDAAATIRGEGQLHDFQGPPPVATVTLAEIYATQGHYEQALRMLDEVIEREPEHTAARRLRERIAEERDLGPGRRRKVVETKGDPILTPQAPAVAPRPQPEPAAVAEPTAAAAEPTPAVEPAAAAAVAEAAVEPVAAVAEAAVEPAAAVAEVAVEPAAAVAEVAVEPAAAVAEVAAVVELAPAVEPSAAVESAVAVEPAVLPPEPAVAAPESAVAAPEPVAEPMGVQATSPAEQAVEPSTDAEQEPPPVIEPALLVLELEGRAFVYWRVPHLSEALRLRTVVVRPAPQGPSVVEEDYPLGMHVGGIWLSRTGPGTELRAAVGDVSSHGFAPLTVARVVRGGAAAFEPPGIACDPELEEAARQAAGL